MDGEKENERISLRKEVMIKSKEWLIFLERKEIVLKKRK